MEQNLLPPVCPNLSLVGRSSQPPKPWDAPWPCSLHVSNMANCCGHSNPLRPKKVKSIYYYLDFTMNPWACKGLHFNCLSCCVSFRGCKPSSLIWDVKSQWGNRWPVWPLLTSIAFTGFVDPRVTISIPFIPLHSSLDLSPGGTWRWRPFSVSRNRGALSDLQAHFWMAGLTELKSNFSGDTTPQGRWPLILITFLGPPRFAGSADLCMGL